MSVVCAYRGSCTAPSVAVALLMVFTGCGSTSGIIGAEPSAERRSPIPEGVYVGEQICTADAWHPDLGARSVESISTTQVVIDASGIPIGVAGIEDTLGFALDIQDLEQTIIGDGVLRTFTIQADVSESGQASGFGRVTFVALDNRTIQVVSTNTLHFTEASLRVDTACRATLER